MTVPRFMDVHSGLVGVTPETVRAAHRKDQAIEREENVRFIRAWVDPKSGKAFCLSEAPSSDAVMRVHDRAGNPATEIYEVPIEIE
jgi:hypothetical protein